MRLLLPLTIFVILLPAASAQVIRQGGNPYSSQLLTNPDAGTIQGIQRYGKPLPTDPEQGSAYPYFVRPSVRYPFGSSPFSGSPTVPLHPYQRSLVQQHLAALDALSPPKRQRPGVSSSGGFDPKANQALFSGLLNLASQVGQASSQLNTAEANVILAAPPSGSVFVPRPDDPNGDLATAFIAHQPLVQIKLRVVEVSRNDNLSMASTLDYIRSRAEVQRPSEFRNAGILAQTPTVNEGYRNLTGLSRFSPTGLVNVANGATSFAMNQPTGAGALINLSKNHMNWIASILAEELEADVLTAPELVTTNGESAEFVAGSSDPFVIGTVRTGDDGEDAVRNHVFYKHVGTYIKVTPRVVNLRAYGAGRGDVPVTASDISPDGWPDLIRFLLNEGLLAVTLEGDNAARKEAAAALRPYTVSGRLVPLEIKSQVLDRLNQFSRRDLRNFIEHHAEQDPNIRFGFCNEFCAHECEADCDWDPEDCTIDIEVLARFSNKGSNSNTPGANPNDLGDQNAETGVRAISNIIQLKNDTGLVMAGLLGESDVVSVAKIPILGDLPVAGALFRGKSVGRRKTELLIFIEAKILDQNPGIARSESASDLHLAAPYVSGGTLDNPLEVGLHRAGFGTYLPPPTCEEEKYWEEYCRRINRIRTAAHDALR